MSWDRWGRKPYKPKKAPPEDGIKMKESGTTWWGRRWIEALEGTSQAYAGRLSRGRTYARAGRTHDLKVKGGEIGAKVTGSGAHPYKVRMAIEKLSDAVWAKAIGVMASKAQFAAELLSGQMPQAIDEAFQEAGASLFPVRESDLLTDCSCPDWANPCKHVAATHYVLGEALDRDPFLLFELRGRSKKDVLEALRLARSGEDGAGSKPRQDSEAEGVGENVPAVSLGKLRAADYEKPRETFPALRLTFEEPPASGVLLRQLGPPPGWVHDKTPVEMLGPIIRAGAVRARALALAEPGPEDVADSPSE